MAVALKREQWHEPEAGEEGVCRGAGGEIPMVASARGEGGGKPANWEGTHKIFIKKEKLQPPRWKNGFHGKEEGGKETWGVLSRCAYGRGSQSQIS